VAARFTVAAVDQNPHPLIGGPMALQLEDEGEADVPLDELFKMRDVVLYCVEAGDTYEGGGLLVWLEVTDAQTRERQTKHGIGRGVAVLPSPRFATVTSSAPAMIDLNWLQTCHILHHQSTGGP
jgi:hypothetical protein